MTRKKVTCPRVKVDTFWVAEWHELTGVLPDAKKIAQALRDYMHNRTNYDCKRGRPRKKLNGH